MSDYYIIITDAGAALEAAAHAAGTSVSLTAFGVCDGGTAFTPDTALNALPNEIDRWDISSLSVSADDPSVLVAQCIIPASSGGYTIRGIGIYAGDTLYAIGNYPDQPKPAPDSGYAASLEILAQLAVSDTADVTLNVTDGAWLTKEEGDQLYVPLTQLQTSKDDATAGHIMTVGAFGLGGAEIGIPDGTNIYKFFATAKSGNYGGGGNLPGSLTSGWRSFKWQQHGSDSKYGTLLEFGSDGKAALHVYNNANGDMTNPENYWSNHGLLYGEKNKPSAADVGALSTGGGTLSGQLTVSGTGHGSYASQRDAGAPVYQLVDSTSTSEYWPIIKQKYKQKNSAWSLGMLINANRFNVYYSDPTQSNDKSWSFNADGTFVPPNYSNFDAKYQAKLSGPLPVSSGGTGSTTAAGARTNLGCGTAATMSYSTAAYTQLAGSPTEAASTKQLVGLRDAVYTKTAGDARYQLKNTASKAANGWSKDTTTGVIVQWGFTNNSSDNNTYIKFPIAFPSACTTCVTIPKGSPGWSPNLVQFVYALSTTACNISAHDNDTSRGQYWIAYGY